MSDARLPWDRPDARPLDDLLAYRDMAFDDVQFRTLDAPPRGSVSASSLLTDMAARAAAAHTLHVERSVFAQLEAFATDTPPARDIMANVRRALRTIENAKRTVVVHPSAQHTVTEGLADWPLVTVVASSLIPEGTVYVIAAGTLRLEPDARLVSVVDGQPVPLDPRSIVRVTDAP